MDQVSENIREARVTELEYWTQQVKRSRISRREFMGRAAAFGLSAAAAATALTEAGVAQTPNQGGTARFGLAHGHTTDTMDPAGYPDLATLIPFWGSMSNGLTEVDANGNITADLCESFEPANSAKTWVFKLRKGLTFHNGKDVSPDDIVASFRYHMGPNSKSAANTIVQPITDIKTDGGDTVIMDLNGPNADFPYIVSDPHLPIMPMKDGIADWRSGVRTGPFVLEAYEPGVNVKMKRFVNYHKEGKPHFDEVEFLTITDLTARSNALKTGQVDWISRADVKTLNLLLRDPKLEKTEVTGWGHYGFPMDVTAPPFNNVDVRTAMKWAIDREEITQKVFLGHGIPGNDDPIAASVKFAVDPKPKYTYDPDKAKFYLNRAGMQDLSVGLSVADAAFNGCVDAAVLYQQQAKRAGINLNVIREPNDGFWDNVWLKKPFVATYWSGRPTCDWLFTVVYAKGAVWNETKWANPRFDELLVKARGETDDQKRAAMYAEMQQLIHDDGGMILLAFNNYVDANSKKLAHGKLAVNWEADGARIAEKWWFA